MADSNGYNVAFTDEDQEMMVGYMSLPPEQQPYICGWVTSGTACNWAVIGNSFSIHLRDHHGIVGDHNTRVRCNWVGCGLVMNKESIVRHIMEKHLQLKHSCDQCGALFSRRNTLVDHIRNNH